MGVIISVKPPEAKLYSRAVNKWGVDFNKGTVFTVGNTIHSKFRIPEDLMRHELTHVRQQAEYKGGYKKWWEDYFASDEFRLSQEVEAYRVQWRYIEATIKDRNEKSRLLQHIIGHLSGTMYGKLVTRAEAKKLITGLTHAEQVMEEN